MKKINLLLVAIALLTPVAMRADTASDRSIESTIESSYNYRVVLAKRVNVEVHDGVATLRGTVLDNEQKELAVNTARDVSGVVGVDDRLTISNEARERTDGWIALKARSVLLVHANVSATKTKVDVHDGVVTLGGTADNLAQKELTEEYVKDVDGVKSVTNNMQLAAASGNDVPERPTLSEKIDDTSITVQVKYALLTHRSTSAVKTKVETHEGAVVITGEAGSDAEKDLVTKLARDIRGVVIVDNRMTIHGTD
jgi:osmotically-inducible protein OsmY